MDPQRTSADLHELVGLILRQLVRDRDLSLTAALTLATLERHGPIKVTTLAGCEGISQPSMTQLVQRLESRGLVTRTTDPGDARVILVSLTPEGVRALAERRVVSTGRIQELLSHLAPEQVEALAGSVADALPALRESVIR